MQRVEQINLAQLPGRPCRRRYGPSAQQSQRRMERSARRFAVAFGRWAQERGLSRRQTAEAIGRSLRTVASWNQDWKADCLRPQPLGRPAHCATLGQRNKAIATLAQLRPHTGVPTCQGIFPDLARRQVQDIVWRFKRACRRRCRRDLARVTWRRPGTVWAMDHSYPSNLIDGLYRRIFALRDLASGCQLAWDPVPDESAEHVVGILVILFVLYGPPLVIKADHGSPFISQALGNLLDQWGVVLLLSPVRRPQYNGSVEAANGSMKIRTEHQAALAGRPGEWISGDLAVARQQANQLPRGPHAATPHNLLANRPPISDRQRQRFAAAVAYFRRQIAIEQPAAQPAATVISARPQGAGLSVRIAQPRSSQGALERRAIVNALSACGLLHIRRRLFTPPITS